MATLTFIAERPGKATLQFVYTSPTATDDSNVTGFLADQPASLQKPQERLVVVPESYSVNVVGNVTPTPTPVSPTPSPCRPRPSCLDTSPYCKLALPPGGWCPGPTTTPRPTIVPPPPPPTVTPTPTTTPTPTPTPEPRVMINFRLQLEGRKNHATVVDIYGMTTTIVRPSKEVLQALGAGGSVNVTEGSGAPMPVGRMDKLGTAVTDPYGNGILSLDPTYAGSTYLLFAQTPSHLRKAAQNYQAITLGVGQNPVCRAEICTQEVKYVDFGTLIAGDVYADANGSKDNLINTFDAGVVFANWSSAYIVADKEQPRETFLPEQPALADLNGDGVVNNRDLAMLMTNFNKRGDTSIPPSDIKVTPAPRPLPVTTVVPQ